MQIKQIHATEYFLILFYPFLFFMSISLQQIHIFDKNIIIHPYRNICTGIPRFINGNQSARQRFCTIVFGDCRFCSSISNRYSLATDSITKNLVTLSETAHKKNAGTPFYRHSCAFHNRVR